MDICFRSSQVYTRYGVTGSDGDSVTVLRNCQTVSKSRCAVLSCLIVHSKGRGWLPLPEAQVAENVACVPWSSRSIPLGSEGKPARGARTLKGRVCPPSIHGPGRPSWPGEQSPSRGRGISNPWCVIVHTLPSNPHPRQPQAQLLESSDPVSLWVWCSPRAPGDDHAG